jgi:hypothetical protein
MHSLPSIVHGLNLEWLEGIIKACPGWCNRVEGMRRKDEKGLRNYTQDQNRDVNIRDAAMFQIPDELLEVRNAR